MRRKSLQDDVHAFENRLEAQARDGMAPTADDRFEAAFLGARVIASLAISAVVLVIIAVVVVAVVTSL